MQEQKALPSTVIKLSCTTLSLRIPRPVLSLYRTSNLCSIIPVDMMRCSLAFSIFCCIYCVTPEFVSLHGGRLPVPCSGSRRGRGGDARLCDLFLSSRPKDHRGRVTAGGGGGDGGGSCHAPHGGPGSALFAGLYRRPRLSSCACFGLLLGLTIQKVAPVFGDAAPAAKSAHGPSCRLSRPIKRTPLVPK